jgi:hypothetical protein
LVALSLLGTAGRCGDDAVSVAEPPASEVRASEGEATDTCSKAVVEAALKALGDDWPFLIRGKAPPTAEELERRQQEHVGMLMDIDSTSLVGAFRDAECHEVLVTNKIYTEGVMGMTIHRYRGMKNGAHSFEEALELLPNPVTTGIPQKFVDFDGDGLQEILAKTWDMDTSLEFPYETEWLLHRIQGDKLLTLWQAEASYDDTRARNQEFDGSSRMPQAPPYTVRGTEITFRDVDNDGADEIVATTVETRYADAGHKRTLGSPSTSSVTYRYNGTKFVPISSTPPGSSSTAASTGDPSGAIAQYRARLSARDYRHHRTGAPLRYADQVIRQDRVNYHVLNSRDPEDQGDPILSKSPARGQLNKLLEKAITPQMNERIMKGTPLVEVTIWTDRASVRIISE